MPNAALESRCARGQAELEMLAWPTPASSTSIVGLGGGLAWVESPALCAKLVDRFDAETFDYFGVRLFSFVGCEEITDALARGFSTWSANHGRVSFFKLSGECETSGTCELAEVVIDGSDALPAEERPLRVTVEPGDASAEGGGTPIRRVTLTFATGAATCYYMDATVCEWIRALGVATRLRWLYDSAVGVAAKRQVDIASLVGPDDFAIALTIARCLLYLPALLGLIYLIHNLVILRMRSHRAGCAHGLYVLATLSHRWRLLTLLLVLPPLVEWKMLNP